MNKKQHCKTLNIAMIYPVFTSIDNVIILTTT